MFNKQQKTTKAALILAATSFVSYLLGLFRDRTFAYKFGASSELDAYNAAFIIPDFFFNLLVAGAISAAFIPVFSEYINKSKQKQAWRIANSILNLATFVLIVAAIIIFFTIPYLIKVVAPGFNPETQKLAVNITRVLLLSSIIFGASNTFGSILVSLKKFTAYAISPALYNLGIILGTIFLSDYLGMLGTALGVVLGALLHLSVRLIGVFSSGFKYKPVADISHPGVRQIIKLMIPKTVGMITEQTYLWTYTVIGSTLTAGSIAIFNFSRNLQSLPVSLIGIALATAVFPTLAEKASLKKQEEFIWHFSKIFRLILFLGIPASIGMFLLKNQISQLLLGTGKFGPEDIKITAFALGFFCLGITAESLIHLLARSFYAFQNTITPVIIAIACIIINIIFSIWFSKFLGVAGLTLAFSSAYIIQMIILIILLKRKLIKIDGATILKSLFKISLATILMGFVVYEVLIFTGPRISPNSFIGLVIQTGMALILGLIAYFGSVIILKCKEFKIIKTLLFKNRLK